MNKLYNGRCHNNLSSAYPYSLLSFFQSGTPGSLRVTEDYPHSIELDSSDQFTMYWKYTNTTITFEAHVRTLGYIGVGISPDGGMSNSDIVIGWVKNGKAHFHVSFLINEKSMKMDLK